MASVTINPTQKYEIKSPVLREAIDRAMPVFEKSKSSYDDVSSDISETVKFLRESGICAEYHVPFHISHLNLDGTLSWTLNNKTKKFDIMINGLPDGCEYSEGDLGSAKIILRSALLPILPRLIKEIAARKKLTDKGIVPGEVEIALALRSLIDRAFRDGTSSSQDDDEYVAFRSRLIHHRHEMPVDVVRFRSLGDYLEDGFRDTEDTFRPFLDYLEFGIEPPIPF